MLGYLASLGAVFIKFDAGTIFGFAARSIAATFGILFAVFTVYKDYKFTKNRDEPSLF
ncbi:hypothetical protein [uncultured Campylobacter sp.]|uniref:hypothetical protein n=1 Tax=uncultured Campylobacter sp. TaxID=218934 RepID=UPI002621B9C7|nr:hypothetical protein [uncultured Campylobacter sp.]